jgi:hypothetical protein
MGRCHGTSEVTFVAGSSTALQRERHAVLEAALSAAESRLRPGTEIGPRTLRPRASKVRASDPTDKTRVIPATYAELGFHTHAASCVGLLRFQPLPRSISSTQLTACARVPDWQASYRRRSAVTTRHSLPPATAQVEAVVDGQTLPYREVERRLSPALSRVELDWKTREVAKKSHCRSLLELTASLSLPEHVSLLSFAKTPSGGRVVDPLARIRPQSQLDDLSLSPPASTTPLPLRWPPPARP